MSTGRIQALTDGVYAIAMTILVLTLDVPATTPTSAALLKALLRLAPKFFDFTLSFLLLAIFWSIHHRHFHVITRVDIKLLWINIFSLLFVVLIPFTTTLYGEYRNVTTAAIFFELNILVLGLIKYVHWSYATAGKRLVSLDLPEAEIVRGRRISMVTPVVALVAIAVATFSPENSTSLFMLVPILTGALRRL